MIWFTLILFVVSFLVTALLAPKPDFENARPESLDPENFPRATESDPVPLVLGTVRVKGANTLWYGDFSTKAIRKKVKTGLFSSTYITTGYEYNLGLDLGLCLGPARLKDVIIDDRSVVAGTIREYDDPPITFQDTANTDLNLNPESSDNGVYTELDLITDVGLTAAEIAQGGTTFTTRATARIEFSGSGDPMAYSGILKVTFFESDGSTQVISPGGIGSQGSAQTGSGDLSADLSNVVIPATARFVRAFWVVVALFPLLVNAMFLSRLRQVHAEVYVESSKNILEKQLFGGKESGGGWVGNFSFYPGIFPQTVNTYIESVIGVGNVPAYNGTAHIVFEDNYIGESPNLRKMEFIIESFAGDLGSGFSGRNGLFSLDQNPVEAIYHICIDPWRGLGLPTSMFNTANFKTAAETMLTEDNGCSLIVSSPRTGKSIIKELLRQIDGILIQNATTGQIEIKLIRDDYNEGTLPIYDEDDIIAVRSFTKSTWADVRSQVKVTFASRDKDTSRTAIAQNMATANMVGRLKTSDISFPFCYDENLANRLAHRELAQLSVPLLTMQVEMTRTIYDKSVGDVIKIAWPEYGITSAVMRILKVDLGELTKNKIVVDMVQDIFAVNDVVFSPPVGSGWVDARPVPSDVGAITVVDMPRFFTQALEDPTGDTFSNVIPFPIQSTDSSGFTLNTGVATNILDFFEPDSAAYPVSGLLVDALLNEDGQDIGVTESPTSITIGTMSGGVGDTGVPTPGTTAEILAGEAGLLWGNSEWMGVKTITDNLDGTYELTDIVRGLAGTTPLDHPIGTRFFFMSNELLGTGLLGASLAADGTLYYKVIDEVGGESLDPDNVIEQTYTTVNEANRPHRPRNILIDGARDEATLYSTTGSFSVTWSAANRETLAFKDEVAAAETPDQAEVYDLEVWFDGEEEVSFNTVGATSPFTMDLNTINIGGQQNGEIRIYSRRTVGDLKTSLYYGLLTFKLDSNVILLSGDEQVGVGGVDGILLSGDENPTGTGQLEVSGV